MPSSVPPARRTTRHDRTWHWSAQRRTLATLVLLGLLVVAGVAEAHDTWLLPDHHGRVERRMRAHGA